MTIVKDGNGIVVFVKTDLNFTGIRIPGIRNDLRKYSRYATVKGLFPSASKH